MHLIPHLDIIFLDMMYIKKYNTNLKVTHHSTMMTYSMLSDMDFHTSLEF